MDAQAPSQCYFDFGLWCARVEVWDESRLCDVRQECREFCSGPPPPMNISASDGEDCEGVLVTWRHEEPFPPQYEVYRSEKPERCIPPFLAAAFGERYFDSQAAPDTTYYYSVRAITPCGPSACSNADSGYRGSMFADWNADCDVRLDDYAVFASCVSGPDVLYSPGCEVFDSDLDDNVDLTDVAAFQRAFTGP